MARYGNTVEVSAACNLFGVRRKHLVEAKSKTVNFASFKDVAANFLK
jgi:hypothetical protein